MGNSVVVYIQQQFAACALHNSIRNHQVHSTSHFEFARSTQSAVYSTMNTKCELISLDCMPTGDTGRFLGCQKQIGYLQLDQALPSS